MIKLHNAVGLDELITSNFGMSD